MNAVYQFLKTIQGAGLTPPGAIIPDGKLHRFASNGKRGDDSGWYVFHEDGIPAGAFGDWRSGLSRTWRADIGRDLTPAEMAAHQARVDAAKRAREEEETRRKAKAAGKAAAIFEAATQARGDHPYLVRKQVAPVASLGEIDDAEVAAILGYAPECRSRPLVGRLLVVPVENAGELRTLELIDEAGRKSALYGGPKKGGYWEAQELPDGDGAGLTLLIGEGVATVLSAREATGHLVVAALYSSNLLAVARAMRKRFPAALLGILADLIKATGEPDPHAIEAARAVAGLVAVPDFGENRPEGATDFNDLAALRGVEAVQRAIADAKAPVGDEQRPGNGAAPGQSARTTAGATNAPAFVTAAALWGMQHDPTRWAVPGVLPEGVTIFCGKPKTGKSWLALDVAIAVGTGGLALGAIEVDAGPVLYLALEDTKRRLTKRLRKLCGNSKPPPEQIEFLTDCPRLGAGGEEVLREWLQKHPTARL